jgi:hypothetical protein
MFEWRVPVLIGRNHNLSLSIGVSIFFIDDYANESVTEPLSQLSEIETSLMMTRPFRLTYINRCPEGNVIEYYR